MQAFLKTGKLGQSSSTTETGPKGKGAPGKRSAPTPWVEKYRPRTVDDVAQQGEVVAVLRKCLEGADLPNLLFYGPPGTGKTSTILAAGRQLFGDLYKDRILELNASDERGIQVIREKVKNFAQLAASGERPDGKPCPPFKIVILDEADSMTNAAQSALRRMMEKQTKSTRFCLICNYVSRIIDPLTSRCSKFRFKPLGIEILLDRLNHICKQESVTCDEGALERIVDISGGDLRMAITSLQSCARLKGGDPITEDDVSEVMGAIPSSWINKILDISCTGKYNEIDSVIEEFMFEGFSVCQLLVQMVEVILRSSTLSSTQKCVACEKLAECNMRLMDGGDEYLQLMDFCCALNAA